MIRKICALLGVCLLLLSFTSCSSRIPRKAETIYTCVEGERIPFDELSTGIYSKELGCVVLRSKKDVEEAMKSQLILRHAFKYLDNVDFWRYAVICISRDELAAGGELVELLRLDGKIGAIYEYGGNNDPPKIYWEDVRYPQSTLLLVRKTDLRKMKLGDGLKVPCTQYACNKNNPDRFFILLDE